MHRSNEESPLLSKHRDRFRQERWRELIARFDPPHTKDRCSPKEDQDAHGRPPRQLRRLVSERISARTLWQRDSLSLPSGSVPVLSRSGCRGGFPAFRPETLIRPDEGDKGYIQVPEWLWSIPRHIPPW